MTLKRINNFVEDNYNLIENNNAANNDIIQEEEENTELKINLNEKINTPGIFEHTVPPGRYLLEVEKKIMKLFVNSSI